MAYLNDRIPHTDHVLSEIFDEREEAPLCVEPRVCAQFFVIGLEALDYPRNPELVIALGAIKGTYPM